MNLNQHTIHFGSEGTKIPPMGEASSLPGSISGGIIKVSCFQLIWFAN